MSRDEYARLAGVYDLAVGWALAPMRRAVADLAAGLGWAGVLDLCGGTAALAPHLAARGIGCLTLDLSGPMLAQADPDAGLAVRADARLLPLADDVVDGCVLSFCLHENDPAMRPQVVREAVRVVRPGGGLAVADFRPPRGLARAAAPVMHAVERLAGRRHYAGFRDFMANNGVPGLLAAQGLTAEPVSAHLLGNAAVYLALIA